MEYKLMISEKPSVGMALSKVLGARSRQDGYMEGNGWLVSWCIGHLVELAPADTYDPRYSKWNYADLPIIPDQWQYQVLPDTRNQFNILRQLMKRDDVEMVVCATDAGREGELIFRLIYNFCGCTKSIKRLWISSMEESAIRKGAENLRDGADYDNLYAATLCRAKADWLIGINATRLFSVIYRKTLTVGRVQTPTLKMLVDRETAISSFKKEKYYVVHIKSNGMEAVSERINDPAEAVEMKTDCQGMQAVCTAVVRTKKTEQPPKLYDLTTLQREANRLFGFTAKDTLDCAQALYEKRLLTYPRTDSRFLSDDMEQTASTVVTGIVSLLPFMAGTSFTPNIRRVLNSSKVSDHHAVIPTAEFVKRGFTDVSDEEKKLLSLVCSRLLCAVAGPHIYEAVSASFTCADAEFTAKGKKIITSGWEEIDRNLRISLKTDADESAEDVQELPELSELFKGQTFDPVDAFVTDHFTSPPKHYTEDTILSAMERAGEMPDDAERKGLGTPATRAAILEKLVYMGFVQRRGKQMIPTQDGINLISILPETLSSPSLTAQWENCLTDIAKGAADPEEFMSGIEEQTRSLVREYSSVSSEGQKLFQPERVVIGVCPRCGEPVYEGKKNYYCSIRNCQFVMWKNDRFFQERKKKFTPRIAAALL